MCQYLVTPGSGHFEKVNDRWATIHFECVLVLREAKQKCLEMQDKAHKTKEQNRAL
jgi:hypothetical protein